MDRPPSVIGLQPDVRLCVLAVVLALAASVVSFAIFRRACEGGNGRRLGWLMLAAASCAFGIWAANLVCMIAHADRPPADFDGLLIAASIAIIVLFMGAGFAIAAPRIGGRPAVGGAVSGAGMGIMQYLVIYAVVLPGTLVWNVPLVLLSVGLGTGLTAGALIAFQRLQRHAVVWTAAALLTAAFVGLHSAAIGAAHLALLPAMTGVAGEAHHWILAMAIAGAALAVLVVGSVATAIDRQTIRENVRSMQELVDTAIEGIVVAREGRIESVNRRITELCGHLPKTLIGNTVVGTLLERPIGVGESGESLLRTATAGGARVRVGHQRLSSGEDVYTIHDLTERRAAEATLQRRNEILQAREEELQARNLLLDTALKHLSQGLCMYDREERVVVCNERYATIYGLPANVVKPGMTRRQVIEMRIAHGVWAGASAENYLVQRTTPITGPGHLIQEMSDGRTFSLAHVPMPGGGWVCTHEDITERRRAEQKIEHLARHDALTDLPNRFLLRDELHESLQRLRADEGLAVHCLDLDRFKEVNDAIGHCAGDELLQGFAARLRSIGGEDVFLARTGGNEFVIVQPSARSPTDATELAANMMEAMNAPFELGGHFQVVLTASIGIAMAPGDGTDADQLIKHANLALHRTKQEQRGHYRFFEKDMDARMRARHELECNLRNALADGELELHFQPLLNVKRNEIACFEALLRWRTRAGEVIPPGAFIPLAEETGLIVPIGEWALRRALAEAAKWPRRIRVAVNLSPVQFNSRGLCQVVMSALAASGMEASRLELEITETALLREHDATLATLHKLRDLGVRIALDDFGTGFSSLNYLRAFPFDKLKIDQCFIAGLAEGNEESLAIVRAVARLGTSLGIATAAEGIETQVQMDVARREGFTEVQGYWIGRPKSAQVITAEYDLRPPTRRPRRVAPPKSKPSVADSDSSVPVDAVPRATKRAKRARSP